MKLRTHIFTICFFIILGAPLLYYAYKNSTLEFGGSDGLMYYKLYSNWDFAAVDSPFNQRLISSWCIYAIHLTGIHYNTQTQIAGTGIDPQVYFSALLFNFICVVLTCYVITVMVRKRLSVSTLYAVMAGTTFLMGFGTIMFLISALSDALSVLLVALIYYFYVSKSRWQYLLLALAIIQREYIFMVYAVIAAVDWLTNRKERKYFATVTIFNLLCFAVYIILRKTYFYTPRYKHQMDVGSFLDKITHSIQDFPQYLRQTFFLQNLLFLYAGVIIFKLTVHAKIDKLQLLKIVLLFGQIVALSFLIGLGNNTGRYFYMCTPIIIYALAQEARAIFGQNDKLQTETDQ